QDFAQLRLQSFDGRDDLTEEEQKQLDEARETLRKAALPFDPWPQDGDGVSDAKESLVDAYKRKAAQVQNKDPAEIYVNPVLQEQLQSIDAMPHEAAFQVLRVVADTYDAPDVNINLLREVYRSEWRPLEGGDDKEGPFYRPVQMESSWLAMDDLLKQVANAEASAITKANNGEAHFEGDHPEAVLNLRGRLFTVKGRLFMLRKQPLRPSAQFTSNGRKVESVYFGIVCYHKKSATSNRLEHHSAAFSAVDIPEDLKVYALEADQFCSNDDRLAYETVNIELRGAYLRRFCFTEPVSKISTDRRGDPSKGEQDRIEVAEFTTEAYMPWLVTPTIDTAEITPPTLEEIKAAVDAVATTAKVTERERQRFDEAGYYLCLAALNEPDSPLAKIEAHELVLRMLDDPAHAHIYRGARAKVAGILQDTYHTLVLRPNISGKRHLYRTFVLDTLDPREGDTFQQWYVDLLEPPVRFAGKPRVMLDGFYYRSQKFAT
ncbi:MAG: hypothetical protein KDB07_08065, partial [Planctomycetes bacterium]|nr:hypothetical protein [Planctomycetota bacterium]